MYSTWYSRMNDLSPSWVCVLSTMDDVSHFFFYLSEMDDGLEAVK